MKLVQRLTVDINLPKSICAGDSVEFLGMNIWCIEGLDRKDEHIYGIECMEKHEGYAT